MSTRLRRRLTLVLNIIVLHQFIYQFTSLFALYLVPLSWQCLFTCPGLLFPIGLSPCPTQNNRDSFLIAFLALQKPLSVTSFQWPFAPRRSWRATGSLQKSQFSAFNEIPIPSLHQEAIGSSRNISRLALACNDLEVGVGQFPCRRQDEVHLYHRSALLASRDENGNLRCKWKYF